MHTWIHNYTLRKTSIHTHIYNYTHTHIYNIYIHTYIITHIYIHTYIISHICTHTYIITHIHSRSSDNKNKQNCCSRHFKRGNFTKESSDGMHTYTHTSYFVHIFMWYAYMLFCCFMRVGLLNTCVLIRINIIFLFYTCVLLFYICVGKQKKYLWVYDMYIHA
jgi:hypothetical protein